MIVSPIVVTVIVVTVFVVTVIVYKMESTWIKIGSKWIKKSPNRLG